MPLFRPQLNNPNQSSTTSMIDVNRSIGILYGKNFERIFFFRLLSRFTSSWILSSLCCWMQCIRYFCNHRRSCTFIWYCISFRRFASRFDAPSCICIDWNYALFAGFSHQTNFSIQVGAFHSLLLFLCSFFGLILLLFRCCFSPSLSLLLYMCACPIRIQFVRFVQFYKWKSHYFFLICFTNWLIVIYAKNLRSSDGTEDIKKVSWTLIGK